MTGFRLPTTPFARPMVSGMKAPHDPLSGGSARYRMNADEHTTTKPVLEPAKPIKPFRYRPAFMQK